MGVDSVNLHRPTCVRVLPPIRVPRTTFWENTV